jgi:tRNA pseudouridine38-40 synthase
MRNLAGTFVGMHDFSAFAQADSADEERSTRVLLERIELVEEGSLVLVSVEGSHFLWRMVRRLVGVLVAAGRGELQAETASQLLAGGPELPAKLTAPASGLFLERVFYKGESRDVPVRAATPVA